MMNNLSTANSCPIESAKALSKFQGSLLLALGEVLSLMIASPMHKKLCIAELEHLVVPPMRLGQFQLFHQDNMPIGYASWAFVNSDVDARLSLGEMDLAPKEWRCGNSPWLVDLITPYGNGKQMLEAIKKTTFPSAKVKALQYSMTEGKPIPIEF